MTRRASSTATAVAAAVLLLCAAVALSAADADKKLYPACGGKELTTTAGANETTKLRTFDTLTSTLTLDCIAYEVVSLRASQSNESEDYCLIEHQTEYAYSLALQAEYTPSNGSTIARRFPIRDMTGGSLAELTARMPARSKFSIVFTNLASDARCKLRLRALVSYNMESGANAEQNIPSVAAVEPRTVYTRSTERSTLVLDYGAHHVPSSSDIVFLTDFTQGTCAQPNHSMLHTDYSTALPPTVHLDGDRSQFVARTVTLYDPNTYRVCYRQGDSTAAATQIAVLTVFSGNPAYYDIVSGLGESGEVLIGTETTIKFFGYDLDTRRNGDEAMFVDFTAECDSGSPAGGVPLANDLDPEDNYGPNTTYSLWTWTLTRGGSFKVCYKRKAAGVWTEVPYIEDVAAADRPGETSTAAPTTTPTNPATGAACPVATPTQGRPWLKYKSAELVLAEKKLPDKFFSTLSRLLCLKRAMLTLARLRHNKEGKQVVLLVLNCEEDGAATTRECDSVERFNYLVSLSAEQLSEHGIVSVQGSTHMFAIDDDTVGKSSNTFGLVLLSLSILAAGGMVVFAVGRYQERRHHFVQFGLDDDDVDDMYDFNAAPASAMRNEYDVAAQPAPAPIRNAVIELED